MRNAPDLTEDNKELDEGYGVHACDSCGKPTGNCQDMYGNYTCNDCKESD